MTPSRKTKAPAPPDRSLQFIVDTILPRQELHIIGGPAQAGKTSLMFRIMEDWRGGRNVFGYKPYPSPFCYVSCVHSIADCVDIAVRMGAPDIPMVSALNASTKIKTFDDVYALAEAAVKGVRVIFLDGILRIAGCSGLENTAVGDFLTELHQKMKDLGITIVATGRCAKPKESRSTIRSIDRFLGATAWTEFASSFIGIEPRRPNTPTDDRRVVTLMSKRAASKTFQYRFSSEGKLLEVSEDSTADSADRIDQLMTLTQAYPPGWEFNLKDLLELATGVGVVAPSTARKYISILVRRGDLLDGGRDSYFTPQVQ